MKLNDEQKARFIESVAYEDASFYNANTSAKIKDCFTTRVAGANFPYGVNQVRGITEKVAARLGAEHVSVNGIVGQYIVKNFGAPDSQTKSPK